MKGGNIISGFGEMFRLEGFFGAKLEDERSGSTVHKSGVRWIVQNWELVRLFTLGFCKLNISLKYWRGAIFKNQKYKNLILTMLARSYI
jgi:hypothetical protein